MMANLKSQFRSAAERSCPVYDVTLPPAAKRTMPVQFTRTPSGAWVQVWVWIPRELVELQKGSKS